MISEKALKRLDRLAGKFEGPNAGLVWGIWPLWFVGKDHPFHWSGVYHDLEYLLREMPLTVLIGELEKRFGGDKKLLLGRMLNYLQSEALVDAQGYQAKPRQQVDSELRRNMLWAAHGLRDERRFNRLAHIAYRVVRLLGGFYW